MKYKPLIAFGILIGNEAAFAQTINAGDAVLISVAPMKLAQVSRLMAQIPSAWIRAY
jgi:hypothetical protein